MKKILSVFIIVMFIIASAGVFSGKNNKDNGNGNGNEDEPIENLDETYVQNFINQSGISSDQITDISQVDYTNFPAGINILEMNSQNLAIYQINYTDSNDETKSIFVLSYSAAELTAPEEVVVETNDKQFLNFGYEGIKNNSVFLKTSTGVQTGSEKGYVMVRSGSITGISTNLELLNNASENIEITIYKNGEEVGFRNEINTDSVGSKKDYDIQAIGNLEFEAGDLISVYLTADAESGVVWKDVITLVEITATN
ncbi:MAG: hypothetical protein KJ949_02765 [Nanoarchaeota archaeon]|nr:hypothetical protein [Nanoarchaeota archaeon]